MSDFFFYILGGWLIFGAAVILSEVLDKVKGESKESNNEVND